MARGERGRRDSGIVHPSLTRAVDGLSGYVGLSLAAVVGVYGLSTVLTTGYIAAFNAGSPDIPIGISFLAGGVGLFVPMAIVWWWLDPEVRSVAFPFRRPSTAEVGWTLACVPLGIAAFTLGTEAAMALGFEYPGIDYDLTDPLTAVGVLVGPLVLAPIVEELLFRGLLLGSLLDRGLSPATAALASILAFAVGHIWIGVPGVIGIAAWAVFPTILRLRFNNLTGATLLHLLNNVFAYVLAVAFSL